MKRDTQGALAAELQAAKPPKSILVSQEFIGNLAGGPFTDSFGLVWEMPEHGILKCNGVVWKIDFTPLSVHRIIGIAYRATWPD